MRDSGQLLLIVHSGLVSAGYDVAAIYRELGYQPEGLPFKELRMHHPMQVVFWDTAERVTGDPDLALKILPHLPPYRGEVLEYLMFSSPTLGAGCARVFKYLRLVSDALNVRIERGKELAKLVIVSSPERNPVLRHTELCVVWSIIQFAKSTSEGAFQPAAIRLSYEQRSSLKVYESVFGCPMAFNAPHCEIDFPASMLDWPSPRWDPDLLRVHEEVAERRLLRIERQDLIERVEAQIALRLEADQCELEPIAAALGLTERRLRFELSQAGTSFTQLLADFRFRLAKRLLAHTHESIDNVVYLTGFSEPSTFYRAFKRWSGMTPVQYRDHKQQGAPAGGLPVRRAHDDMRP
jgi:AraC-like DNA-binding protein